MPAELTRSFLEKVVRSSGWALSEVESLSLEGESISCLGDSFAGVGRLVYLSLARNNISSLLGVEHLSSLSTVILSANRVSSMSEVGRLARLPNLRNLDLRLNPIMAAPPIGGSNSGSGTSRNVGGGGRNRGVYSQHDATTTDAAWGRREREDFCFPPKPREMVLEALPQLVNLDGQKVEDSERRELRRRSAVATLTLTATNADRHEEGFASAGETRRVEHRVEGTVSSIQRSSWPLHDSEVNYGVTDAVGPASRASTGGERGRPGFEGEVVGATRSYDGQDLRRVGTAPPRGRVADGYADTGVRKRDRTGAGVFESGGQGEGVPSLRAGSGGRGGSRAVEEVARSQQHPVHIHRAAGNQGGGTPPGAAALTAEDDDLAALWSELGGGFLEFQQPRGAAATAAADRSVSPPRPQCVTGCRRCGCSGGVCECRDPLHSRADASGHTQLFAAELDESMGAVSFPGASRQTQYGPRVMEPRLLSDSGAGTTESARRRKGRTDEGRRRIEARSYADDWDTVGGFDGNGKRSGSGGGGGSSRFRGSSGSSRGDTNPHFAGAPSLVSTAPRSSSSSHGSNQGATPRVARSPDAFVGKRGITDAVLAAETKAVANPANRSDSGGEQREARSRRQSPAETAPTQNVVRRQNPGPVSAPGSLSEPSVPQSQSTPAAPTDDAASTVAVSHCPPPAQSGSSSSSTTTAAARAVEAFRRSSQRLGLVDASKTGSSSPATYQEGGGVAADGNRESACGSPADAGRIDGSSPAPAPPVEVTTNLNTKPKGTSMGGAETSEDGRGTDYTRKASATARASSTATMANAAPTTSTALVLSPPTETAVEFLPGGVAKCQECGANFGKGYGKDPGPAAAAGEAAASGTAAVARDNGLHERWWAREKDFTSRWAEREREFDARWTAREREFDKRRREESKEFTQGMCAMLFEAHNALIASNAWLLERLRAAESVQVPSPAAERDPNNSECPSKGSTLKHVVGAAANASGIGPRYPPPPRRAARFAPDTSPTPCAAAEREGQRRQRPNSVLVPGDPVGASSLADDEPHASDGVTVPRDEDLPSVATVGAGAPPNVRARGEHGTESGRGGTGGRLSRAPTLEGGKSRGQRGHKGRVYRGGEALQQRGDARNRRPLVSGVDVNPAVVEAFPHPRTAAIAARETRELRNEESELPTVVPASSEPGAHCRAAAAVAGGSRSFPPSRGFATNRRSEEASSGAEGERGGRTDLERLASVSDAVGAGRELEQKVEGSSVATAEIGHSSGTSHLVGTGGGGGGGREASDVMFYASSVAQRSGGSDRKKGETGSAEQVPALASAHAPVVPGEPKGRVATHGEGNANRVLDGEPDEPSGAEGQKGAIVGGGARVGVSGGGHRSIVLEPDTALSPSGESNKRDPGWRRDKSVGGSSDAWCPDPEVTSSAPDG